MDEVELRELELGMVEEVSTGPGANCPVVTPYLGLAEVGESTGWLLKNVYKHIWLPSLR
ncbi:hypothetical protein PTI98_012011 [Pleurotus ostreatus]|nr:hypothetical protein PTI98_012011 [Pleurotus ostreatus]